MENENKTSTLKTIINRVTPAIVGLIIIILIVAIGIYAGYQSGLSIRLDGEESAKLTASSEQFELGVEDLENGRCNLALQRFEYIVNDIDPEFPGIIEKMAQAHLCMSATATATPFRTPTPTLMPTLTPTPDFRAVDEIFLDIQTRLANEEFDETLTLLDSLRSQYPEYQPVQVDGLYFQAYRERGEYKILVRGELEGGIFDLNRAENFGPIDAFAENYRNWASWYLIGLSFWDLDWDQVYYYFDLLVNTAPNLTMREDYGDEVYFISAQDRLTEAKLEYAPVLRDRAYTLWSEKAFCDAYEAMRLSNEFVEFEEEEDIKALGQLWGKCEEEKNE